MLTKVSIRYMYLANQSAQIANYNRLQQYIERRKTEAVYDLFKHWTVAKQTRVFGDLICIEAYNRKSRWREVLINGHVISNVLQCKKTRFSTVLSSRLWSYGAFTHTLRWDGMGCAFYGNSMYFNGGRSHIELPVQPISSNPTPAFLTSSK